MQKVTELFGSVSPHEGGVQARPGGSSEELSSLPGGSCQCFEDDGFSEHEG